MDISHWALLMGEWEASEVWRLEKSVTCSWMTVWQEESNCLQTSVYSNPQTHKHLLASCNFPWVSPELIGALLSCTTCSTIHTELPQQHSSHAKPHWSWRAGAEPLEKTPWQITGLLVSGQCSGELLHSLHHQELEPGVPSIYPFCFYIWFRNRCVWDVEFLSAFPSFLTSYFPL